MQLIELRMNSSVSNAYFYAPQTKILEGGTKDVMRIFDRLFYGSYPKSSTHALEKCFLRNPDFRFCSSFQNLRLGWVHFHGSLVYPSQVAYGLCSQKKIL